MCVITNNKIGGGVQLSGYTVIELLLVISILGIVVSFAAPSFSDFLQRKKITTQAEIIAATFREARNEALTKLETIAVCWNKTAAPLTKNEHPIAPGHIAVMRPPSGSGATKINVEVAKEVELLSNGLFVDDDETDDCVSFDPQGRLLISSVDGTELDFSVCQAVGETNNSLKITIRQTGRAYILDNDDGEATSNCAD